MSPLKPLAIAATLIATLAPAKALEVGEIFRLDPSNKRQMACDTLEEIRAGDMRKCGTVFTGSDWEVVRKSGDAVCLRYPNSNDKCSWSVIAPGALAYVGGPKTQLPAVTREPASASAYDLTTQQLITMHRGYDGPEKLGATAYALGLGLGYLRASIVMEKNKGEGLFCPPPKLTINAALVISTLESFMKAFPFAANEDASLTLGPALMETFPCKKA
jgi:hypothetical protein